MDDLSPFHNRPEEWALYSPLVGNSMLELGNKKNREYTYKAFFESRGYRHVSVDLNGENDALPLDLREPLNLGTFDMVTNIGTSEHVDGQEGVWRNIVEACHVGSVLICTTPYPGDWTWHGEWYPHREFYFALARINGFQLERIYVSGEEPRRMWFARLTRMRVVPFVMPVGHLHENEVCLRSRA